MPILVWDKVKARQYESGLDRGVLYLPDGSAVPWNGLISVIEKFNKESSPVYFDGMKISDLKSVGDFSATMRAITYPDEFTELEGLGEIKRGVFVADQLPQSFGLCYRTQVGNDFEGSAVGYKIHILFNVTAIPTDKSYLSVTDTPSLTEFEWEITAVPEEVPGFRPTAHYIIDTADLDPWLLEDIEEMLYGSTRAEASLIPMSDLITFITSWFRVKIVDHGDGTWTATSQREGFINFLTTDLFEIIHINAVYLNAETFVLSDTLDISDIPQIRIEDNGDGTWTAITQNAGLIDVALDGTFEIRNANAIYIGTDFYRISDTTDLD